MSGIVGIVNLDGVPVDRVLLGRMTRFMTYRGPDAQQVWCESNAGFGHTMLRTTFEAENERQPLSLDGAVWLTADARVDGREELIDKLAGKGRDAKNANDAELILHAYHAWEEDCVTHLLGDFAFAIWDQPRRKLFCARDRFGIKLFYYARIGNSLIFSNTLNCIREHPAVSDTLNEQAIGDFLLFGFNKKPTITTFADISRLPAAHVLVYADGVLKTRCYWKLIADDEIRYRRASDYVEHFKEVMGQAVADRLRTNSAGVLISGGLDSTTIAATALEQASKTGNPLALQGYTIVFDRLIPDQERHYSGLAAEALGIPISYLAGDDYLLFQNWGNGELRRPEPSDRPLLALAVDQLKQVAAESRVVFTGWEADALLREVPLYYFNLLWKKGRFGRFALDMWRYIVAQRELPRIGWRSSLLRRLGQRVALEEGARFPGWINEDFAARMNLRERWEEENGEKPNHPRRPTAFLVYSLRVWDILFEGYDPGVTGLHLEARHPFFDLRLMNYLLSLPPVPWCIKKELLRIATRGVLPEAVRLRPKAPLGGFPEFELLRQPESDWVDHFEPTMKLGKYIERSRIPHLTRETDVNEVYANVRPLSLNYWLECLT